MRNYMLIPMVLVTILFATIAAQAQTKATTSVFNNENPNDILHTAEALKVYPTQCVNKLMVDNPEESLLNYRILTTEGREIANGALKPKGVSSINISGYPSGMYYICVTNRGIGNTYRFAKM